MTDAFSTHGLHPRDRIPYWVDVASKMFFDHGFSAEGTNFVGALTSAPLDTLSLVECECGPCEVTRSRSDTVRDGIGDFNLCIRLAGKSHFSQGERRLVVEPGTIFIQDCSQPMEIDFLEQSTSIILPLPRSFVDTRIGHPAAMRVLAGNQPMANVAEGFVRLLMARAGGIEAPVRARLAEQLLDLISMMFSDGDDTRATSASRASVLQRLKAAIDARLSDPDLKPAEAAAAAGISVRYANALLAEESFSIGRYLLHRRLERCRRALEDPLQANRMIGDIAFSWGFSDLSHFTRRFRAEFGMTPSDYRRQARARL